jgi:hypothetical protein
MNHGEIIEREFFDCAALPIPDINDMSGAALLQASAAFR